MFPLQIQCIRLDLPLCQGLIWLWCSCYYCHCYWYSLCWLLLRRYVHLYSFLLTEILSSEVSVPQI